MHATRGILSSEEVNYRNLGTSLIRLSAFFRYGYEKNVIQRTLKKRNEFKEDGLQTKGEHPPGRKNETSVSPARESRFAAKTPLGIYDVKKIQEI